MAKTNPTSGRRDEPSIQERSRELLGYLIFGAAAFLLIACVSFVERDGGDADALGNLSNLCGGAGYQLAKTTLYWFGYGTYLGVFTLLVWAVAMIGGRSLRIGPFRLIWLGLFLFVISALISTLVDSRALLLPDAGGLVGWQIATFVERSLAFGPWGTRLVLFVAAVVAFQLATDFLLFSLLRSFVAFLRRRREQAGAVVQSMGPLFSALIAQREARAAGREGDDKVDIAVTNAEIDAYLEEQRKGAHAAAKQGKAALKAAKAAEREAAKAARVQAKAQREAEKQAARDAKAAAKAAKAAAAPDAAKADPAAEPGPAESDAPIEDVTPDDLVAAAQAIVDADAAADAATPRKAKDPGKPKKAAANGVAHVNGNGAVKNGKAGEPAMLDADPESEIDPEAADAKKVQAKIHFDPPKTKAHRPAGFENDTTTFVAPPAGKFEYTFPPRSLLESPTPVNPREFQKMIEGVVEVLESALSSYKVDAEVEEIQKGPVITMFELNVAAGTRVDRIRALEDDLAIRLKAQSVRIVAPIPGKSTIGIEVPNKIRETVCLRELLDSPDYDSANFAIPVFLGKDAAGRPLIEDLAKAPHLLVAGATGAGKSVCLNSIIMSVLYTRTPDQVKMILIDPKMVELSLFERIPHLMCPVVRDMNRAAQILEWACAKMDERYEILAEVGARNIFAYNKVSDEEKRSKLGIAPDDPSFEPKLPFIVIVVDELADLMMTSGKEVENNITRLAQKSRAVGIHVILATQRPSTNVITGLIKANLPTRISFQVASKIDARVVLDQNGAEKLLGFGDMLYLPPRTSMLIRAQGAYVADEEIRKTVEFIRVETPLFARELTQKTAKAEVDPREVDDLYDEAVRFICETQRGSASLLQRRFSIGYTRASRLIDLMASDGILGEFRNAQAREVMVTLDDYEARLKAASEASS